MSSIRLVFAFAFAFSAVALAVTAQDYPLCATGSLNAEVTNVAWMTLQSENGAYFTSFLALNSTTGDVLCTVSAAPGIPAGQAGPLSVTLSNGGVFAILQPMGQTPYTSYLYRVDTYYCDPQPWQICALPTDLTLMGLWSTDALNHVNELMLLAQSTADGAQPLDLYSIDWTNSPVDACILKPVSSLNVQVDGGIAFGGAGTVDWTRRELYGVLYTTVVNDAIYLGRWSLDSGTSSIVNVSFASPYPGARYLLQLLVAAPVDGADKPQRVFTYWIDGDMRDPNMYWGELDPNTGVLTAIASARWDIASVVTSGVSNAIFKPDTREWQLSVFGQLNATDPPQPQLDFRVWQVNPITAAVQMSESLIARIGAAILRPAYGRNLHTQP